jgi:hypothetical protein
MRSVPALATLITTAAVAIAVTFACGGPARPPTEPTNPSEPTPKISPITPSAAEQPGIKSPPVREADAGSES